MYRRTVGNKTIAHKVTRKVRIKQQRTAHLPIFGNNPIAHFPFFSTIYMRISLKLFPTIYMRIFISNSFTFREVRIIIHVEAILSKVLRENLN